MLLLDSEKQTSLPPIRSLRHSKGTNITPGQSTISYMLTNASDISNATFYKHIKCIYWSGYQYKTPIHPFTICIGPYINSSYEYNFICLSLIYSSFLWYVVLNYRLLRDPKNTRGTPFLHSGTIFALT